MAIKKERTVRRFPSKSTRSLRSFPIVGVGSSAGGLEAFSQMLTALPADSGMAVVFVEHLDAPRESTLPPLLEQKSNLPVLPVMDGIAVQPNHVYITPANARISIQDGVLRLTERAVTPEPIDYFFQSLAADCKEAAMGVILSDGADGVAGLEAIKAQGGICFAQDHASARVTGTCGVCAGMLDYALPPLKIAAELLRIARSKPMIARSGLDSPAWSSEGAFRELLLLLRNHTGVDFNQYKPDIIHARIARRMLLKKFLAEATYVQWARNNAAELEALFQDILAHVTGFFRDREALGILEGRIISLLMKQSRTQAGLRIWVPGCSTGEEAYSIAMALSEYMSKHRIKLPVRIFATDINEVFIRQARAGVYGSRKTANLSAERLKHFFVEAPDGYQVAESIREMCTFARHDLARDPPFSNIDLISCQNVLAHFEPTLQEKVVADFHYSLHNGGFVLVDQSETLKPFHRLFSSSKGMGKFYGKRALPSSLKPPSSLVAPFAVKLPPAAKIEPPQADLPREAERIVWTHYGHAGVIADENLHVTHFRGDTSAYLAPASSAAGLDLLKILRRELLADFRTAFQKAKKKNTPVLTKCIPLASTNRPREVCLEIVPLTSVSALRHYLVLFNEALNPPVASSTHKRQSVTGLQRELSITYRNLQAIIEDRETKNEQLRALNEEFVSNNEELQSANEELETAREELQCANQELVTLSEQQASRNAELARTNDDLTNVLDGVQIPILLLDSDRQVRRFTPSAGRMFNLLPTDLGRAIDDLRSNLAVPDLPQLISRAVETLTPQECEVRDLRGRYYSMSVRPYRRHDHKIDGVLIALFDTDAMKRSIEETRRARDYALAIVETVREPLVVLDSSFRVVTANRSFFAAFQLAAEEVDQRAIFELADGAWNDPGLRGLLEKLLPDNAPFSDFKLSSAFPKIGFRTLVLNARRLEWEGNSPGMILVAVEDLTERELTTEALRQSRERLRHLTAGLITAQEEERKRIARDLHDDLNQRLAMITVELETLERKPPRAAEVMRRRLETVRLRIASISDDIRQTAHQLHPSTVDHLGLSAAMRSLCADVAKSENIQVRCRERNVHKTVPADVALCLYRVAQEAIHNVVKHSGARRVRISLINGKSRVLLSIRDEGRGFDYELSKTNKGLGIVNMEERARLVGGKLSIRSVPGKGTRVVLEVPLLEDAP